jgi:hypothetical protein
MGKRRRNATNTVASKKRTKLILWVVLLAMLAYIYLVVWGM